MKTFDIIIVTAVLVVLPIDLLYLYYAGGWIEPNQLILNAELTILYLIPLYGLWLAIRWREERRR